METSSHHHGSQSQKQVSLFRPYCGAAPGSNHLGDAVAMFSRGELVGARQIQNGQPIAFSLAWQPGQLPADPCPCTLTVNPIPGACYQFSVPSYQVVLWFLEVCHSRARHPGGQPPADMPQSFWTQLFSA
ncbi:MAG: hypothetical protein F4226_06675 [Synechococcus sp. SB0678_bin_12]|uniref:Uncharacterized protein n=1 Tax=Synechococcus sp. SB0676_bin_10 TaxID=2604869 RepID=A0A6B1FA58_9SYNE|nr:hypothetical protein [Synechococcus sp. SB0664_bin_36]MYF36465.1 hypothetical protein [Synechococcus sp. SB0678_bin_12]MYG39107.1 hypothetical protein [Synechococcus sp. SB0676_bin_10]MYI88583.1 hypothetical protein [Synechococcus sp. SB0672_bin_10]MYK06390.1 hypothetical protein [Synechococcus sp. SB0670_bin_20]